MRRKSKMMLECEERLGETLEDALPRMVTQHGLSDVADICGVSKATMSYWLLKLDLRVQRVCYNPIYHEVLVREKGTENCVLISSDTGTASPIATSSSSRQS